MNFNHPDLNAFIGGAAQEKVKIANAYFNTTAHVAVAASAGLEKISAEVKQNIDSQHLGTVSGIGIARNKIASGEVSTKTASAAIDAVKTNLRKDFIDLISL